MGKEWYWGGKSSKRSGHHHSHRNHVDRSDTVNSSSSSSSAGAAASAGCMCAVFQLFDFHQFHFTSFQPDSSHFKPTPSTTTSGTTTTFQELPEEEANIPKCVEAPRNSMKSEEGETSLSSIVEEEEEDDDQESLNLNIPIGIHIKTSTGSASRSDTSSNSPGTKTPSLVARLMGLDLLPENNLSSPPTNFTSPSCNTIHTTPKQYHNNLSLRSQTQPLRNKARHLLDGDMMNSGTRSLPETPRISSARRSDVDHHHRLSLQINKENVADQDLDLSKLSALRRNNSTKPLRVLEEHVYESSRSPRNYAWQIVKQVKESVSRRVGSDITNTVTRNRSDNHLELVTQVKSKRVSKGLSKLEEQASRSSGTPTSTTSSTSFSCSPRLMRFTTSTNPSTNTTTPTLSTNPKDHRTVQVSTAKVPVAKVNPKSTQVLQPLKEQQQQQQQKKSRESHVKNGGGRELGGGSRYGRRIQKMQEETFVRRPSTAASCRTNVPDKKCKKTPLSNNLLNLNVVPSTLLSVKKSPSNSPPSTNKHVFPHKVQPAAAAAEVPDDAQESKRSSQTLSSSQSQKYHDQKVEPPPPSHVLLTRDNITNDVVVPVPNSTATATATAGGGVSASESEQQQVVLRHYITKILAHTGIASTSHVSFTNWFSPSHPLDPSIFHRLEASTSFNNNIINLSDHGQFRLRCNRRLLFDVVDEILIDILRPHINLKPWININYTTNYNNHIIKNNNYMQGSELIDTLCMRIKSFPCRDCQILEDIDSLIDRDLPQNYMKIQREMTIEEEGEGLVSEIERDMVDTLVHEMALILVTLERRRFGGLVQLFDCLTVD